MAKEAEGVAARDLPLPLLAPTLFQVEVRPQPHLLMDRMPPLEVQEPQPTQDMMHQVIKRTI